MISESATGMSNGGRASSASPAVKKTNAPGQLPEQPPRLPRLDDARQREGAGRHGDGGRGEDERQFVRHQLRGGAQSAQQGVLVGAGPAGHQRAEHPDTHHGQDEEQARVELLPDQVARPDGDDDEHDEVGHERDTGRQLEHPPVGARRHDRFLLGELHAVGHQLRPAVEAAGVHRAEARLHVRHRLVLHLADEQRQGEERDDDEREPQRDLEGLAHGSSFPAAGVRSSETGRAGSADAVSRGRGPPRCRVRHARRQRLAPAGRAAARGAVPRTGKVRIGLPRLLGARPRLGGPRREHELLAQRVALEAVGQQQRHEVRVVGEADAEHLVGLALVPGGAGEDARGGRQRRGRPLDVRTDQDSGAPLDRPQVGDDGVARRRARRRR
jgi:hypothetical protein